MQYVFGHQNPDTDSILSALVLAEYFQDQGQNTHAVALGTPNRETQYVLQKFDINAPEVVSTLPAGSEIFLVDHTQASQSIANRDELIIKGIFDHHKIADIRTSGPTLARISPVGCTGTVLFQYFKEVGYSVSKQQATLMIASILSDTLIFKSPTSTDQDRDVVETLLPLTDIEDVNDFGMEMLDAKSNLSGMDPEEIVRSDFKISTSQNGQKFGIGVLETTNPTFALKQKDAILDAIRQVREQEQLSFLLFCVIDVLNETNMTLVADTQEQNIITDAFDVEVQDHVADLGNRVSRKKQIMPFIG